MFTSSGDRDGFRVRVDAVLNKLGNCLQWVALPKGDDANRIPIVPDHEFAVFTAFRNQGAL